MGIRAYQSPVRLNRIPRNMRVNTPAFCFHQAGKVRGNPAAAEKEASNVQYYSRGDRVGRAQART
jgi:hypothetical protein